MKNNPTPLDLFLEELKILLTEYGIDSVFFGEPDEGQTFIYCDKDLTKPPLLKISSLLRDLWYTYEFLYVEQIDGKLRIVAHFEVHGTGGDGTNIRYYYSVSELTKELKKSMYTKGWSKKTREFLRRLVSYCKGLNFRPQKLR